MLGKEDWGGESPDGEYFKKAAQSLGENVVAANADKVDSQIPALIGEPSARSQVFHNAISNEKVSSTKNESTRRQRAKSTLRLVFEAEKELIIARSGDLEFIRHRLGLSARKLCQLLLVDASAWSRWIKNPKTVPPHIYRALEWYLLVQDKHPSLHPAVFLSSRFHFGKGNGALDEKKLKELYQKEIDELKKNLEELNKKIDWQRALGSGEHNSHKETQFHPKNRGSFVANLFEMIKKPQGFVMGFVFLFLGILLGLLF